MQSKPENNIKNLNYNYKKIMHEYCMNNLYNVYMLSTFVSVCNYFCVNNLKLIKNQS